MNKHIITILVICLLLSISSVGVSVNIEKSLIYNQNGKTLYVGGSGEGNYTQIMHAIDDAEEGDTVFVYDDSSPYYENVRIDKSINLTGENKNTTIIDGGDLRAYVISVQANNVIISGFTLQNSIGYGITLFESHNIDITNNIITNNKKDGIQLWHDNKYNEISNNYISNNLHGISLASSSENVITGNRIVSNKLYGINLYYTHPAFEGANKNIIEGNNISKNPFGIRIDKGNDNNIKKNNFIRNIINAFFGARSVVNIWDGNYWNKPRILPKPIFGVLQPQEGGLKIPWVNFDWHPARAPYDIP